MSKSKLTSDQQDAAAHADKSLHERQVLPTNGESARPAPSDADGRHDRIAVRAYYAAERRGFPNDAQLEDWLNAEREIDNENRSSGKKHEASMNSAKGSVEATAQAALQGTQPGDGEECIAPDQMKDWARRLKVPASKLREAIQRVGTKVSDVTQALATPGDDREATPEHAEPAPVAGKTTRTPRKKKSDVAGTAGTADAAANRRQP